MTTDTAEFHFERHFALAPNRMWHLLTDAKMRAAWSGPGEGMVLSLVNADFRRHGIERHLCGTADAPEFEVETRWYHINAPTDAVFTESIQAGGQDIATSLVSYRLAPSGTGSTLYVTVAVSSFVGADASSEFREGWEQALSNLKAFAQTHAT